MNDHPREAAIFDAALQLPPPERMAYLDQTCAGDLSLRQRIEALLNASERTDNFLDEPVLSPFPNTIAGSFTEKPGDRIGRYKLLQQIGEGGCGVVYMAEQQEPVHRRVALKVIKLGMDTQSVIARFEAERQALALMDHPNIAKVLDAGATETGRPYFVMELVRGVKITEYCDQQELSTHERLGLFIQVCQAIQHAHQKGIIHRDIKPSNILVTVNDGLPVPKVIDFGIAKATGGQHLTDKTLFTAFEQFIGTPAYMSPEQAILTSVDIDTRSDIYALGVLLYELLTGQTPFDAKELLAIGLDEMRRTIREHEPERPSTRVSSLGSENLSATAQRRRLDAPKLVSQLRGDLDWIVMKALEKDRSRRYDSANGFAADIQRHLNNEPVAACPPSNFYRLRKMARRHKLAFAAGMSVAAALLIGLSVSTWMFVEQKAALRRAVAAELEQTRLRQVAEANEKKAATEAAKSHEVAKFLENMLRGVRPSAAKGRDTTMLREVLDWTAGRVGRNLTNQPAAEAELRSIIGDTYDQIAEFKKAEEMYREALRLRRALFGPTNEFVASSIQQVASVLNRLNKPAEAESMAREALAIHKSLFGSEHAEVAWSLNTLGNALSEQGKHIEAEAVARQILEMRKKLFGAEHADVAGALNDLGTTLHAQRQLVEAEAMYRDALALENKLRGSDHPDTAMTLNNLASVLGDQGKKAEAELFCRQALAVRRKVFGDDHPYVAFNLQTLSQLLTAQKKHSEAEAAIRKAIAIYRKRGDTSPGAINILALLLKDQGKALEAEALYRETLETFEKTDKEHIDRVTFLLNLGVLLRDEGKLSEAEANFRQALALAATANHPHLDHCASLLAALVETQGRLPEEALAIYKVLPASAHGPKAGLIQRWMGILFREGKLAAADKFFTETLALEASSPLENALFLKTRGRYHGDHGDWQKAAVDLARSFELNPKDTDTVWHYLAPILVHTGQLEAYRELCRKILNELGMTTNPAVAERIAKDCLIVPSAGVDLKIVAQLADLAASRGIADSLYPWFQLAKGLAEYRQGNSSNAVEWSEKALIKAGSDPVRDAQAWLVKAMALQQLAETGKALAALNEARELVKPAVARLDTAKPPRAWNDWMTVRVLLGEATGLIEAPPVAARNGGP